MYKCKKCGHEFEGNFCSNCGAKYGKKEHTKQKTYIFLIVSAFLLIGCILMDSLQEKSVDGESKDSQLASDGLLENVVQDVVEGTDSKSLEDIPISQQCLSDLGIVEAEIYSKRIYEDGGMYFLEFDTEPDVVDNSFCSYAINESYTLVLDENGTEWIEPDACQSSIATTELVEDKISGIYDMFRIGGGYAYSASAFVDTLYAKNNPWEYDMEDMASASLELELISQNEIVVKGTLWRGDRVMLEINSTNYVDFESQDMNELEWTTNVDDFTFTNKTSRWNRETYILFKDRTNEIFIIAANGHGNSGKDGYTVFSLRCVEFYGDSETDTYVE